MNDLLLAERALTDAGAPLHVTDLAARIHGRGWDAVRADSLDAMLAAKIAMTIRRDGARSPFRRVAPCVFALHPIPDGTARRGGHGRVLPFSRLAARAVRSANDEALAGQCQAIEIDHLLAGVASVDEGPAADALDEMGVERSLLRQRLREARRARDRPRRE